MAKNVVHDKLVTKVIAIDISRFVLNMLYNTDKSDLQIKKVLLTRWKRDNDTNIIEIVHKIHCVTWLDSAAALNAAENKISNVSDLVKTQTIMQKYLIFILNILTRKYFHLKKKLKGEILKTTNTKERS